jgi:hypothetical protein
METGMMQRADRRAFRRVDAREGCIVSARVRPGRTAIVVDICAGGASIDVAYRLLPGASIDLQLDTPGEKIELRGRIVRCAVVRLRASSVLYRAGIAFAAHWTLSDPRSQMAQTGRVAPTHGAV